MRHDLDAIRRQLDCRTLATEYGIRAQGRGAWVKARCFNAAAHNSGDANPSLRLSRDRWSCMSASCGLHGDAFDLVAQLQRIEVGDAIRILADRVGIRPPPQDGYSRTRLRVHEKIWKLVGGYDPDSPLRRRAFTEEAIAYLHSRSIEPYAAIDFGCRDWWPVMAEIVPYLRSLTAGELQASGFGRDGKLWWPVDQLCRGNLAFRGLCIPVWDAGVDYPVAWRWRPYVPIRTKNGVRKSLAQPGPSPKLPLGLQYQNPGLLTVIAEGEPDWLSIKSVTGEDAQVLGITDVSREWRQDWTVHLDGARRVLVMVHDKGVTFAQSVWDAMCGRYGLTRAQSIYRAQLLPEANDANDLLQAGRLEALLTPHLQEVAVG